ncbi:MAG: aminotransferase class I/II-fold pyridoxal phosphate-dependent enzyme [Clostridia bacterium]|nr:aminotransferase class I/II-fold pyridoxal phosphate-dependent enzyme [Clostridia bacterium]
MSVIAVERMSKVHSDIRGPLFVEANKMAAAGIPVLKLNTGNPGTFEFKMPASVREALLANVDGAVAYCDVKGMPAARQAICDYHRKNGLDLSMDRIFIGNGVSEIASMIATALFAPGDEILMPAPCYSLWTNQAYIAGAQPVLYICDEQSDWYPDMEDIRSKITDKTKAILLINPNNPTGAVYPLELLEQIVELAREKHLMIISDEIYDRLIMDDIPYTSVASIAKDIPVLTCNGLSKSHIICGFRCGWVAITGPEKEANEITEAIQKLAAMRLCGNALTQLVIPAAMADPESTREMLVPGGRLYEQRRATTEALDKIDGITYVKNRAAFYLFPKVDVKKFGITSDKQFALDVLHGTNVLFVPGSGFDWQQPDHFRIVMLPEPAEITAAMERIGKFLETYHA